jgi:hypothetical protein
VNQVAIIGERRVIDEFDSHVIQQLG